MENYEISEGFDGATPTIFPSKLLDFQNISFSANFDDMRRACLTYQIILHFEILQFLQYYSITVSIFHFLQ